jgi:hypothetical protein
VEVRLLGLHVDAGDGIACLDDRILQDQRDGGGLMDWPRSTHDQGIAGGVVHKCLHASAGESHLGSHSNGIKNVKLVLLVSMSERVACDL